MATTLDPRVRGDDEHDKAAKPGAWRRLFVLAMLLLACTLAQAQDLAPIPPLTSPVVDTTGTLDAATKQQLESQALALQQRKGSQLQVLMVPTTQPEDIAEYGVRAFEQWKIGRKGVDDGVLLVVAKNDRRVRIEVGYGLEGAIPDATSARVIQEYLVPKFRSGDFAGGITDASAALVKLIDGEPLPAPMADHTSQRGRGGSNWLFALFVAFVAAQFARGIFRGAPTVMRGLLGGAVAGGIAWLLSSLVVGGIGAMIGFFTGLASMPAGRYARDRGYGGWGGWGGGGGGWGGGGGFGGGGGGWGGGGGMSGGGGASGSW